MKMNKLSLAVLGATVLAGSAHAATPTLKEVLGASGITATGYVDAAYTHFDTDSVVFAPNYFDSGAANSFRLKQAGITFASQPAEGFGALVNLTGGTDAMQIHSAKDGVLGSATTPDLDVTQAFVQYAGSGVTVMAGKYNTLAGAEVIAPNGNTNISRSIAFLNALPFTHTGVRVSYAPVSSLTLYAGVNNGWDQVSDTNRGKTTELGVSWSPAAVFSGAVYGYIGDGSALDATFNVEKKTLVDVVATIKPLDPLAIILNYDSDKVEFAGAGGDAKWTALNVYVNYQFTDKLRTSLRAEQFDDKDGYNFGPADNKIKGLTLTVGYAPEASFELRGEVRQDKADVAIYTKDGVATDKQNYFAVEGLYKF